jgi:hypothetical protein
MSVGGAISASNLALTDATSTRENWQLKHDAAGFALPCGPAEAGAEHGDFCSVDWQAVMVFGQEQLFRPATGRPQLSTTNDMRGHRFALGVGKLTEFGK